MMAKKKVTKKEIDNVVEKETKGTHVRVKDFDQLLSGKEVMKEIVWHDMPVQIKLTIGFEDYFVLTKTIAEGCFAPDGTYMPANYDFVLKNGLLAYFTNVTLPDNMEKRWRVIYETDLFPTLLTEGNDLLIRRIRMAVDEMIDEMRAQKNSSAAVLKLILEAVSWIPEVFKGVSKEELDEFIKKLEKSNGDQNA